MNITAIDIGGTSIKAGAYENGELIDVREFETNAHLGGQYVMEKALEIVEKYPRAQRIGISTAGQVEPFKGEIIYANENIPNYTGTRVKEIFEEKFSVPTVVDNDVNAAALGEAHYGAGKGHNDFVCLTYGTGVGGAIVNEGKLYRGSSFSAGEFGSILVHPEARDAKRDLLSGCYEQYASTTALVKNAMDYDESLNSGRKIFAEISDPAVKQIIDDWIKEISYGIYTLINILNPSCVVLGGGIMNEKYILEEVKAIIKENVWSHFSFIAIEQAKLGNSAGLYGVIHRALNLEDN